MHLDVATGGELHIALHAGVPAERLVLRQQQVDGRAGRRSRPASVASLSISTNSIVSTCCTPRPVSP